MPNHFHLVVETPQGNLAAGMGWLLSTYSNRFNHRHERCGHLFSGRYKALVVEGSGDGYLRTVCDYTHLNPARARLLAPDSRLLEYPWSSYGGYLTEPRYRPKWLRVGRLLGEHGIGRDTEAGRREFERRREARRASEGDGEQWKGMRRGWCLGSEPFKRGLLERLHGQLGPNHAGEMRRQANQARAEGILAAEMKRLRWKAADLTRRAKSDPGKLALAALLRRETTMPCKTSPTGCRWAVGRALHPNFTPGGKRMNEPQWTKLIPTKCRGFFSKAFRRGNRPALSSW
jgi:hypothetical protein